MTEDPIRSVESFDCRVPLPRPLSVGTATVTHRAYVLVRVRTESGVEGVGFAFGRGLPVARVVQESLAPVVIGADAARPEAVRARMSGAYWPYAEGSVFAVAASAVDLALWDLLGRRLGAPLADILGRMRDEVPATAVATYAVEPGTDTREALEVELAGYRKLGFATVKLVVGAGSPDWDAGRLAVAREVLGEEARIVVDAFRSFAGLEDALRRLRRLEPYDLAYVEDPFSESLAPLVVELRRRSGMSIGLGESLSGHRMHRALIESGCVDVVRCDATVIGGVRELMAVAALASARGLPISLHTHPEVHVHFAAAIPNLYPGGIEYMDPEAGLDAFYRLLATKLAVRDGRIAVPDRPGLGLDLDWDAVGRYAA